MLRKSILSVATFLFASTSVFAGTYKTVHVFKAGVDGNTPISLTLLDGTIYGVTAYGGGACLGSPTNCGTFFKVDPKTDRYTLLRTFYNFEASSTNNIFALDGKIYITSQFGGRYGFSNIFKVNTDGSGFQTIYDFRDGPDDGSLPIGLSFIDGAIYGSTTSGGPSTCFALPSNNYNCGTLFKVPLDGGKETILYEAANAKGGINFSGQVVLNNLIYVSALYNKDGSNSDLGAGLLFSYDPKTKQKKTLYTFNENGSDGGDGTFLSFAQGNVLYGIGGTQAGAGNIWSYDTATGKERVLYSFQGGADGSGVGGISPTTPGGLFYGFTGTAGNYGYGTFFQFDSKTQAEKPLFSFGGGGVPGVGPAGNQGLIYVNKAIYGVTQQGPLSINPDGTTNPGFGTIYKYVP